MSNAVLAVQVYTVTKESNSCLQQNYVHDITQATPSLSGVVQKGLNLVSPVNDHGYSGPASSVLARILK